MAKRPNQCRVVTITCMSPEWHHPARVKLVFAYVPTKADIGEALQERFGYYTDHAGISHRCFLTLAAADIPEGAWEGFGRVTEYGNITGASEDFFA